MRGFMMMVKYSISVARALFALAIALFLPQICLWNTHQTQKSEARESSAPFTLGIQNVTHRNVYDTKSPKNGVGIALVTNSTSLESDQTNTLDALLRKGLPIKKVLIPQAAQEKKRVAATIKSIPTISLLAKKGHYQITKDILTGIDTLMVDIQDTGMQYATSSNALLDIMKAASMHKKKCIILDRPNLLGWCMEGFCSQVPLRNGMTIGEIASYYNKYILRSPIHLTVVPMNNYNRCIESGSMLTNSLSSEIKNIDSCYGYSFLGLLNEVAPFDIGLGTDKAFQCVLLPDKIKFPKHKWLELGTLLKDLGVESKEHRYYSNRKKTHYSGLRLHINDINHFSSFNTLLTMLSFFKRNGVPLQFSPAFDKALGSPSVKSLIQGTISKNEFALQVNNDLQLFFKKHAAVFFINHILRCCRCSYLQGIV